VRHTRNGRTLVVELELVLLQTEQALLEFLAHHVEGLDLVCDFGDFVVE
jgi:hypothetical protein